ncbi:type II toxin-antitoxin system HicA family toxin [bacterium]|nr:type II toxin-antitoxin system HicA family toxin [bacterium]
MSRFVVSQSDFIRILTKSGFVKTSQRGSHQYWKKHGLRVTVDIKYSEYSGWLLNKMIERFRSPQIYLPQINFSLNPGVLTGVVLLQGNHLPDRGEITGLYLIEINHTRCLLHLHLYL